MTTTSEKNNIFSMNLIETNIHTSGIDKISTIIITICSLLIITVIVIAIFYLIKIIKIRIIRERKNKKFYKSGSKNGNDYEIKVKVEDSSPVAKLKNKRIKDLKYVEQHDTSPKEEKEGSSIYRHNDGSHANHTTRRFLNEKENTLNNSNSLNTSNIANMPFGNRISNGNFLDHSINNEDGEYKFVDVSFKGAGDHDKSMSFQDKTLNDKSVIDKSIVTYEKRLGNLFSKESSAKRKRENKNNQENKSEGDDSRNSRDNEDKNEKNPNEMEMNNDELENKIHNLHAIDSNQYMTANFVNALEDFDKMEGGFKNSKLENDRYTKTLNSFEEEHSSKENNIYIDNPLRDSSKKLNNFDGSF